MLFLDHAAQNHLFCNSFDMRGAHIKVMFYLPGSVQIEFKVLNSNAHFKCMIINEMHNSDNTTSSLVQNF